MKVVTGSAALALVALAMAGCGGSSPKEEPPVALLTAVEAEGTDRVTFLFRSPPRDVTARYVRRDELIEDASGAPAEVAGSAFIVVRFEPASGMSTYAGPNRSLRPGRASSASSSASATSRRC